MNTKLYPNRFGQSENENVEVYAIIILKTIFKEMGRTIWPRFIWLREKNNGERKFCFKRREMICVGG
jgi:hypothetical protein